MGDIAIRVQGLSKQYRIGKQERYHAFRDVLTDAMYAPFRRVAGLLKGNAAAAANLDETIWALKDVSFEVKKGDVIGIIGRNGAGKSTLLKILSRITDPTEGQVDIYGRIGALLEVGTGFHPELTGRENVYLNGAILGMSRDEIRRKFDEIIGFAEVEKFIDTPVKHYSSGMGLRLGFAVAAHLEPEILVVDEVLAVGDASFQKKCLGKMSSVADEGRTVLFVSHNMAAVKSLCTSGLMLEQGKVAKISTIDVLVQHYLEETNEMKCERVWEIREKAPGNDIACIRAIRAVNSDNELVEQVAIDDTFLIEIEYEVFKPDVMLNLSLSAYDYTDVHVFAAASTTDPSHKYPSSTGQFRAQCVIPANLLNTGRYIFSVLLVQNETQIIGQADHIISVEMIDLGTKRGNYFGYWGGVVRPALQWKTKSVLAQEMA